MSVGTFPLQDADLGRVTVLVNTDDDVAALVAELTGFPPAQLLSVDQLPADDRELAAAADRFAPGTFVSVPGSGIGDVPPSLADVACSVFVTARIDGALKVLPVKTAVEQAA